MRIRFNHSYRMRNDGNRALIFSRANAIDGECVPYWVSRVHPIYAMLMSLLSEPTELEHAYEICSDFIGIAHGEAKKMIDSFLNEKSYFTTTINNETSIMPPHLIIVDESGAECRMPAYKPEDFVYNPPVDLHSERLNVGPLGLVWMVTDRCVTDCVYCYAQKRHTKQWLDISVIKRVLEDARELNVVDIALTGGEFFLHPQWMDILKLMKEFHYEPNAISTKMPLTLDMVLAVKTLEKTVVQVSLDSLRRELLCDTLGVKRDYVDRIKESLHLLAEEGVSVQIGTVLTRKTANVCSLQEIYDYISEFRNINRWTIRIGFPSLYSNTDFSEWRVEQEVVDEIEKWYNSLPKGKLKIEFSNENIKKTFSVRTGSQDFPGARCSANYTHCVILPDGNVTICEQLYWHPKFLIGDLKKQSLAQIWQGEKAKKLSYYPQNEISQESPCHSCEIYEKCVKYPNKCYTDVLKAYGMDCWDYPDVRCEFAPPFKKAVFE